MTYAGFELNLGGEKKNLFLQIFLEEEKYTELAFNLKDTHNNLE